MKLDRKADFHFAIPLVAFAIVSLCILSGCKKNNEEEEPEEEGTFVDLRLPSGTLWKNKNEQGFYTFNQATATYSGQLPTADQLNELKINCTWKWTGNGCKVTGSNGKSITITAAGLCNCGGDVFNVGMFGGIWSCTENVPGTATYLHFDANNGVGVSNSEKCRGYSVCLVDESRDFYLEEE